MNFRQQLSEAYKAGFNQGLEDLQEKQSPAGGGSVPKGTKPKKRPQRGGDPLGGRKPISAGYHEGMKRGLMAGYHEAMKEMDHEKDEGYHEGAHEMDEKALAELGRMMIRAGMHEMDHEEDEGYHEGMHEMDHEEDEGYHEGMHEGEHEDEIEEVSRPAGFMPALLQGRLTKPLLGRSHRRKSTPGTNEYDPTSVLSKEFRLINRDMRDNPDDYTFPGGLGG